VLIDGLIAISAVVGNNSKMFNRVMPEKLGAAYKQIIDALCSKENEHVTSRMFVLH
jgi:hypothetical protein